MAVRSSRTSIRLLDYTTSVLAIESVGSTWMLPSKKDLYICVVVALRGLLTYILIITIVSYHVHIT